MSTLADLRGLWADVGELQEAHARRLASSDLARYKGNIEGFVREVLRVERLTPAQLELPRGADGSPGRRLRRQRVRQDVR